MTQEYYDKIKANLHNTLNSTDLGTKYQKKQGKVRDSYIIKNNFIIITSDRVSAFDRILASIPFKGQVLNQISIFWFKKTSNIILNHVISVPDPNVLIAKKCTIFPIEFVVRGYITGTTATSMWTNYQKGVRDYCGHHLKEGLVKNQKLEKSLITPTTKEEIHDRLISAEDIVREKWMTSEEWAYCEKKSLELFEFGQQEAAKHGLLLVDTKYEFGKDQNGTIILVDELHTPDSSRYWIASTYEENFNNFKDPESIDKDILRRWYAEHCDPYNDQVLPKAPEELVITLSMRYIELYERITGEKFRFIDNLPIHTRIVESLKNILD